MKITDPDVIKNGEKDLIDAIKEDLDLDAVKEILKHQIAQTVLSAKGGQIVVHDNQIAFRLDFDLNLSGSLMFDREGNHLPVRADDLIPPEPEDDASEDLELDDIRIDEALEEMGSELEEAVEAPEDNLSDLIPDDPGDEDAASDPSFEAEMDDILSENRDFWENKTDS